MAKPYAVVGLEDTGTHPRLEIEDLQQKPIQFSLFIRAFNKVMNKNINEPDSYWQISSIHGLPYEPWTGDPDGPQNPTPGSTKGGYCYHHAAVFPSWHRVLILLVEQIVVREAIGIAENLPDSVPTDKKEGWVKEARELRFPFWDWTSEKTVVNGIPKIFRDPTVDIVNPDGSEEKGFPNPLNHYKYPDGRRPGGKKLVGTWPRTYRYPDVDGQQLLEKVNGTPLPLAENYDEAQKLFGGESKLFGGQNKWASLGKLREKVARLFNYPLSVDEGYSPNMWGKFSNSGSRDVDVPNARFKSLPSIEDPHDAMHIIIGGTGTMTDPVYASFDPIFYLHHCNVDRIYAFWEYIYPDYFLENKGWKNKDGGFTPFKTDGDGTYSLNPFSDVEVNTPLVPFRTKDGKYWTSEQVRGLLSDSRVQKYYTYPGITDRKRAVEIEIDSTCPVEGREKFRQTAYNEWGTDLADEVKNIRLYSETRSWDSEIRSLILEEENADSYLRNFVIVGVLPEFAFPGSYHLELYLLEGRYASGPPVVVDRVSVFGREDPDRCTACTERQAAGSTITGHMHLEPLLTAILIDSFVFEHEGPPYPWTNNPLDWLVDKIKNVFKARLVKPDGTIFADTRPSAEGEPLEEAKTPRLSLHSHRIKFGSDVVTTEKDYIPMELAEAKEHGEFELSWKIG